MSFLTFQCSLFQLKMVNHYEVLVIFQDIEHQLITLFIIVFSEIFLKLRSVFDPLKVIYWTPFRHCLSM